MKIKKAKVIEMYCNKNFKFEDYKNSSEAAEFVKKS